MARMKAVTKSTPVQRSPSTEPTASSSSSSLSAGSSASDRPLGPLGVVVPESEREEVKVNNANPVELKNACDDAIKRFLSRPELFKQIHLHTDIRLGLGWLSVFVAAGTAFYGYKFDFETAKPVVTSGLIVYILLTTLATLYAYFIEGDTIFVGKRKTFSKRIITERITLSSSNTPASSPSLFSLFSSKPAPPPPSNPTPPASASTPQPTSASSPTYTITLTYLRSTNGGKSLLGRGKTKGSAPYTKFFDDGGVMDQKALEKWVGGLVETAMDGKAA